MTETERQAAATRAKVLLPAAALAVAAVTALAVQAGTGQLLTPQDPVEALISCIPEHHRSMQGSTYVDFTLQTYEECIAATLTTIVETQGLASAAQSLEAAEAASASIPGSTFNSLCHAAGHRVQIPLPTVENLPGVFETLGRGPCDGTLTHTITDRLAREDHDDDALRAIVRACDAVPYERRQICPDGIGHLLYEERGVDGAAYCTVHTLPVDALACGRGVLMQAWRSPTATTPEPNTPWEEYRLLCAGWPLSGPEALEECGAGLAYALHDRLSPLGGAIADGTLHLHLTELAAVADACDEVRPEEARDGCRSGFMEIVHDLDRQVAWTLCEQGVGPCRTLHLRETTITS